MRLQAALLILIFGASCTKESGKPDSSAQVMTEDQLSARGESIYKLNCIACHNADPALDGATGPALKGSSLELISLRVLKAQYPQGYKAKRDTKVMPAMPQLEKEIPALHSFLNSKK